MQQGAKIKISGNIVPLHDALGNQILLLHNAARSQFGRGEPNQNV
jgi:hypothetical protein